MIKVKICGMRDQLNIREIAKAGPDFMGFIFYPVSPRYLSGEGFDSIFNDNSLQVKSVGVFVNEDIARINQLAKKIGLSMVQLHGTETPHYCSKLKSMGLIIIKAFGIDNGFDFEPVKKYMSCCDYFLFDTKSEKPGGSGLKFKWDILNRYTLNKSFFLSGGIGPDDAVLIKTIENRGLYAVDINSQFENSPGVKNLALVKTFINSIKNDRI